MNTVKTVQQIAAEMAQEFRGKPERWMQGAYAKDFEGEECSPSDSAAVCWCIAGKLLMHSPSSVGGLWNSFTNMAFLRNSNELVGWNDAPDRTVADVIALCEKVAAS